MKWYLITQAAEITPDSHGKDPRMRGLTLGPFGEIERIVYRCDVLS